MLFYGKPTQAKKPCITITQGYILHLNFQEGLYFIRYSSFKTAYTLAIYRVV